MVKLLDFRLLVDVDDLHKRLVALETGGLVLHQKQFRRTDGSASFGA